MFKGSSGVHHPLAGLGVDDICPEIAVDLHQLYLNSEFLYALGQNGSAAELRVDIFVTDNNDLPVAPVLQLFQKKHFQQIICDLVILSLIGPANVGGNLA